MISKAKKYEEWDKILEIFCLCHVLIYTRAWSGILLVKVKVDIMQKYYEVIKGWIVLSRECSVV